jgi:hypothetical protein
MVLVGLTQWRTLEFLRAFIKLTIQNLSVLDNQSQDQSLGVNLTSYCQWLFVYSRSFDGRGNQHLTDGGRSRPNVGTQQVLLAKQWNVECALRTTEIEGGAQLKPAQFVLLIIWQKQSQCL